MKKILIFTLALIAFTGILLNAADKQQSETQLNTSAREMSQMCTAAQSRYTEQEVNTICDAAKEAVQAGATQRELVKMARSLMLKNISAQDLAATMDMVKLAVKEGLSPQESRPARFFVSAS